MIRIWLTIIVSLIAGVWAFIDVARTKRDTYGSVQFPYPTYKFTAYFVAPLANIFAVLFVSNFLFWILSLFGIVL